LWAALCVAMRLSGWPASSSQHAIFQPARTLTSQPSAQQLLTEAAGLAYTGQRRRQPARDALHHWNI
jgi:hypothetical protein